MKIYTKTGDAGTTGLLGGGRVAKSSPRIMAYGGVDEINSALGLALCGPLDDEVAGTLTRIQSELFILGADLSDPDMANTSSRIGDVHVKKLESDIDSYDSLLPPLTNFILPRGLKTASQIHMARAITRRTETHMVRLQESEGVNPHCIIYVNRLSDLLFVLSRTVNERGGVADVVWTP